MAMLSLSRAVKKQRISVNAHDRSVSSFTVSVSLRVGIAGQIAAAQTVSTDQKRRVISLRHVPRLLNEIRRLSPRNYKDCNIVKAAHASALAAVKATVSAISWVYSVQNGASAQDARIAVAVHHHRPKNQKRLTNDLKKWPVRYNRR